MSPKLRVTWKMTDSTNAVACGFRGPDGMREVLWLLQRQIVWDGMEWDLSLSIPNLLMHMKIYCFCHFINLLHQMPNLNLIFFPYAISLNSNIYRYANMVWLWDLDKTVNEGMLDSKDNSLLCFVTLTRKPGPRFAYSKAVFGMISSRILGSSKITIYKTETG